MPPSNPGFGVSILFIFSVHLIFHFAEGRRYGRNVIRSSEGSWFGSVRETFSRPLKLVAFEENMGAPICSALKG